MMKLPKYVIHADWGINPRKRWLAQAVLQANGRYQAQSPNLVPPLEAWLSSLQAKNGVVLVGFDFPIGLPETYARQAGIYDFLAMLPQLGQGEWADFYRVAETPDQIEIKRPFYPQRPGGTKQQYLIDGLNVTHINDLRRRCDMPQPERRAAAPLFWTMGAQQVGKAAIVGWQGVLVPALQHANAAIWPFSGKLVDVLSSAQLILAETYPAEFYTHLGISFPVNTGKRSQNGRLANAPLLLNWATHNQVDISPDLTWAISDGFGSDASGEDQFDAVVGLLGMVNLLLGNRPVSEPSDPAIRQIEGWIFGQAF
jgi:hypothetical protein